MQVEQMTYQGTANTNEVDKASNNTKEVQTADADRATLEYINRANNLLKHSKCKRSKRLTKDVKVDKTQI